MTAYASQHVPDVSRLIGLGQNYEHALVFEDSSGSDPDFESD